MSWFKVDDGLADHPKTLLLQEQKAWKGALALWTLAGAWASKHLTDGFVPLAVVKRLGATRAEAQALVSAGFWVVASGGYQFHDWTSCNPTREHVEAKREATRKRVTEHRLKRARNALPDDDCNAPPVPTRPDPSVLKERWEGDLGPRSGDLPPQPPPLRPSGPTWLDLWRIWDGLHAGAAGDPHSHRDRLEASLRACTAHSPSDPVGAWRGACERFLAERKAKRLGLAVLCSQLGEWLEQPTGAETWVPKRDARAQQMLEEQLRREAEEAGA